MNHCKNSEKLLIPRDIWDEMVALARREAPWEACGLLAGKTTDRVEHFYPLTNIDRAAEHFSMKPEEQFAAVKDMRRRRRRMIGIWHSHPATPPRMSEEDKRLAFTPDVLYVILSLADENEPSIAAFRIKEEREEKIPCRIEEMHCERSTNNEEPCFT